MKQSLYLILFILTPLFSFGQDLSGRWSGVGVQKIDNRVITYNLEALIKQEGNKISGKMATVQTGTKNHTIVKIIGTVKNGKVKIDIDRIVKIDFPAPDYNILCFRSYKGELLVDEINNVLIIEVESYGTGLKYDLTTKSYYDDNCIPNKYRLTKKYKGTDSQSISEDTIEFASEPKNEITQIGKNEIKLSAKKVKMKVWDKYEEDGDLINLYLNGELLFSNLEVTRKGQLFEIELLPGSNIIEVEALNEGKVSPNTSAIRIFTNDSEHDIILSAKKGGKDSLKIIMD